MTSTPIDPAHARTALALQDACNPNGVLLAAHTISCEVTREHGTVAATHYAPLELTLCKLSDMLHLPTSFETFERAYLACTDAAAAESTGCPADSLCTSAYPHSPDCGLCPQYVDNESEPE